MSSMIGAALIIGYADIWSLASVVIVVPRAAVGSRPTIHVTVGLTFTALLTRVSLDLAMTGSLRSENKKL